MSSKLSVLSDCHPPLDEQLSALRLEALDEFSVLAVEGAKHALADTANPLRLNFFSAAMRILFEHMTTSLAPIEQVQKCPWFKAEEEDGTPTRWQCIVFAIQGGLSDAFVEEELDVNVGALRTKLRDALKELNKHVHGNEDTIILDAAAQDVAVRTTIETLDDFLEIYNDCRSAILNSMSEKLDQAVLSALISETIAEVDLLATRHFVEGVLVEQMSVKDIGPNSIVYLAEGSIWVALQWGPKEDGSDLVLPP